MDVVILPCDTIAMVDASQRYWIGACPRCGRYGMLVVICEDMTRRMLLQCDECHWTCTGPDKSASYDQGFEGYNVKHGFPTLEEIKRTGWDLSQMLPYGESR